ncbi:MAG: translational GTPase TypA [Opitutales bacterium]
MENDSKKFRNLAIIAHVDHGKTTLVDKLLQAAGTYRENQQVQERAMDSMDLEREKGITIKAKNTSVKWKGHTINIVDTPGHADFGAEVERVMKMVDGVILVVDAFEGAQAQTRFVLRKAFEQNLTPMVVINKIDRPNADPLHVKEKVLELFLELGANDEAFDAPFLYGSARDGYFMNNLDEEKKDCTPLLDKIVECIPAPKTDEVNNGEFQMLISNLSWNDYVGTIAIGKITSGSIKKGDTVYLAKGNGERVKGKATRVFEFSAFSLDDTNEAFSGNIVGISGFEGVEIGECLCGTEEMEALPFVAIDPPTISMEISINDGPLLGQDGKNVTSRVVRERLYREMKTNISIQVEDTDKAGVYTVSARGAMQIAVLVETMRRENFELCISRPKVILHKDEDGNPLEPFETMYVEVPEENTAGMLKILNNRKAQIEEMDSDNGSRTYFKTLVPTRGILGFETELVNLTSGHGIFSHLFREYAPWAGEIMSNQTGRLISMAKGTTTKYALLIMEDHGNLFVGPQEEVYVGQIVGETLKPVDIELNPVREKHLTNIRSAGKDQTVQLTTPINFSIERAIEYINGEELVEVTPHFLRLRKRILDANQRKAAAKKSLA